MTMTTSRTLLVARKPPSPGIGGSSMRLSQHVRMLASRGETGVFWISIDDAPAPPRPEGVTAWNEIRLPLVPGGVLRMIGGLLRGTPCADLFYTAKTANALRQMMRDFRPDTVIVSEVWLARYLPVIREFPATVILDMHNVELPLYRGIVRSSRGLRRLHAWLLLITARHIEWKAVRAADRVWTCSAEDARLLRETYGDGINTDIVPNSIDTAHYAIVRERRSRNSAPLILYCGNFTYYPNAEAAERLIEKIMPLLWAADPTVRLTLVGNYPTKVMIAASKRDARIEVTGFVEDVRGYLKDADVTALPIRQGGGTRLKILEAFAAGIPVVATHKAVEGIDVTDGQNVLLADDDTGIAEKTLSLLGSRDHANTLSENALALVKERYSLDAVAGHSKKAIESSSQ